MDTLERIRIVNGSYGVDTKKEESQIKVRKNINQHFMDTPDYEPEVLIDGEKYEAIVSDYKASLTDKYLMVRPGKTFKLGALVSVYESYYLVTEINPNRQVRTRGRLQQCNDELHWQDKDSLELHSKWCIMQKPYFSNLEDLRTVEVSSREFKILITDDELTSKFDVGHRFMLEIINGKPKTYRVTSVDVHTGMVVLDGVKQGFLIVNIEEDQYNPNSDRPDMMICDYKSPEPLPPTPSDIHIEFEYSGKPEIKQGLAGKDFVAVVKDTDGEPVFGAIADIAVDVIPELQEFIEVTQGTGQVKLKAKQKAPLGTIIKLTATYDTVEPVELDVKVVSIY